MTVKANPYLLKIALKNIIDNAIKYSGCETLNISTKRSPNKMEVIIEDDGTGFIIKDEYVNPKGNGLGIKICKDIMQSQSYGFNIESELDVGTRVTLSFSIGKNNEIKETGKCYYAILSTTKDDNNVNDVHYSISREN
jgi:signal transduction histidine kinase